MKRTTPSAGLSEAGPTYPAVIAEFVRFCSATGAGGERYWLVLYEEA
jgi:hypothetical protein